MAASGAHKEPPRFFGWSEVTLEGGTRFLVPKDMRDALGDSFVVYLSPTRCLVAMRYEKWREFERELDASDAWDPAVDSLTREIYENFAGPMKCDDQGRLFLTDYLRIAAKLSDESGKKPLVEKVRVIGCRNRMEIWSPIERIKFEANKEKFAGDRWSEFQRERSVMKASAPPTTRVPAFEEAFKRLGLG